MNILFSIDDKFVDQLKTLLFSIRQNTSSDSFQIYVLQKEELKRGQELANFCTQLHMDYFPLVMGEADFFKEAPISERYPETIYYRLVAQNYLPTELTRILYLDADILCINDLSPLYQTNIENKLYAAASHSKLTEVTMMINKVRLGNYESQGYFNSGVLLMNLKEIRKKVREADILAFIEKNQWSLLLPDQDILNSLYWEQILPLPDQLYNYDIRKNVTYEAISFGEWNLDWVIEHTVLLHFCGKDKPWLSGARGRFVSLYKHYFHTAKSSLDKGLD